MAGREGKWREVVVTTHFFCLSLCVSVQDFDAMTEDQQMAFAIQMSLHGNQTGI